MNIPPVSSWKTDRESSPPQGVENIPAALGEIAREIQEGKSSLKQIEGMLDFLKPIAKEVGEEFDRDFQNLISHYVGHSHDVNDIVSKLDNLSQRGLYLPLTTCLKICKETLDQIAQTINHDNFEYYQGQLQGMIHFLRNGLEEKVIELQIQPLEEAMQALPHSLDRIKNLTQDFSNLLLKCL